MAIKLTDLLIETIFKEASNDDAILDTLIPNPATGKNIKVRSALSRADHPAYNTAKEFIAGKMGDEAAAQATQQAQQEMPAEEPTEEPTEEPVPVEANTQSDLMSQGFDEKSTEIMMDIKDSSTEIDADLEKMSSIDPGTWKELSPERQKEMNDNYTTKIGEKRDNLRSQIDTYTENGLEAPPELIDEYNVYDQAVEEREVAGMTDTEKEEYYQEKGETAIAKKYQQGLDMIDIDQDLAAQADVFDAEETATGI